jgi:hypothetical protein
MELPILPLTMRIITLISPPSPRRPAVCATEIIIVPKSADEMLWASFANKVDKIREEILRLPQSKIESAAPLKPLIPVPLPLSLSTQI